MKKPDIPLDEENRLKTLRSLNILDTKSEERFDRLTRMAQRILNVPIALVSLVDEHRQWFKSCVGLTSKETPRDISFCGHAILDDKVFIVPDTAEDVRFADNPLVINEPHIRFYAGCPLRFTNGSRLGTLCIMDTQPRSLSNNDIETLKDLASTAERELAAIELPTIDELTKISNRRGFMMLSQHSLNFCTRQKVPAT
jgi:GAF domain-containing protein